MPSFLTSILLLINENNAFPKFSDQWSKGKWVRERERDKERNRLPKSCWNFSLIILERNFEKYPGKINFPHLSEYSNLNMKTWGIIWKDHTQCFWLCSVSQIFFFYLPRLFYNLVQILPLRPQPPSLMISLTSYILRWSEGRKKGNQTMLHLKLTVSKYAFWNLGLEGELDGGHLAQS